MFRLKNCINVRFLFDEAGTCGVTRFDRSSYRLLLIFQVIVEINLIEQLVLQQFQLLPEHIHGVVTFKVYDLGLLPTDRLLWQVDLGCAKF